MSDQPKALWLADMLEELDGLFSSSGACGEAAAELRRLHGEVERLREAATQALEALDSDHPDIQLRAATALRAALKDKP